MRINSTRFTQLFSRNRSVSRILSVGAIIFSFVVSVRAELLCYEGFDYPPTAHLQGTEGGVGFSGPWETAGAGKGVRVVTPGASYEGLEVSGGKAEMAPEDKDAGMVRGLAARLDNGTVYISFLARNTNGGTRHMGVSLYDGGYTSEFEKLSMGQVVGSLTWGTTGGLRSKVASSEEVLLVVRIDFGAAIDGSDKIQLFINPVSAEEPTPNAVGSRAIGGFDRVKIHAGFASDIDTTTEGWVDEIRIGRSFQEVVPIH